MQGGGVESIVSGFSSSSDYPLAEPLDLTAQFGFGGTRDYILSILSPDLSRLVHSSKFGGPGWELGGEVRVGRDGFIYALGRRRTGGATSEQTQDVFVIKLRLDRHRNR